MNIPWDNMDGLLGGNWPSLLAPGTPLFEKWRTIAQQRYEKRKFDEHEQRIRSAALLRP
jgi:hypothetical protein